MRYTVLAVALLIAGSSWAGIGTVSDTKGTACEIQRNKTKLPGQKGSAVESMDTYVTGACAADITFKDDTKVKVTENSRLLIDDFVYDPKQSDAGRLAMKVAMGTVRYASGQIAKNNPQQVNLKTPTATVAVRGTDFTMTVDETGESLVVLVPSCKDERDRKQYELDEQRCLVGKIDVITDAGSVSLTQAFEATYVASAAEPPTPPVVLNTIEGKIGNNLILLQPLEIQELRRQMAKSARDRELEELEAEAQRRISERIQESTEEKPAKVMPYTYADGKPNCNPATSICVRWQIPEGATIQDRGTGVAFRNTDTEHYAEVKTRGYVSNTSVTIIHNDAEAREIIGDGSPGGNVVYIKQNTGVLRR